MARIAQLPDTLYTYDFVRLARREQHACTRERLLGMAHLQKHGSLTHTAEALFVHITTVQNWLNRFRKDGLPGLEEKPRPGRPHKLTKDQLSRLPCLLNNLISQKSGGRVKGKEIQRAIQEQFGVKYNLSSLYFLMHRQGWSWITARSQHPESDVETQEVFKKISQIKSLTLSPRM